MQTYEIANAISISAQHQRNISASALSTVSAQRNWEQQRWFEHSTTVRKEREKRQRVVCYCYFGPHRTSQILCTFSLTCLFDSPHLSCLISPFLFLSDSDYHPIYGSFVRWVKITNRLLSMQHALEPRVSVTSGLWLMLREMKQCIKHSKGKNQKSKGRQREAVLL